MTTLRLAGAALALAACCAAIVPRESAARAAEALQFTGRHAVTVTNIPAGAQRARIWLAVPREDPWQTVIGEIRLTGPGGGRVETGGTYNNTFGYFEVNNPGTSIEVAAEFTVERREQRAFINELMVRPLDGVGLLRFPRDLRSDRYVPVNARYERLAQQIVGNERNTVRQAKVVYDWVLGNITYWVKDPENLKASPMGSSDYCLDTGTGNCTDFHSLYASLTRALGIPTRLVYGSFFQGENTPLPNTPSRDGVDVDGSYHCWIEFYAHGLGWIPLDVALADLFTEKHRQEWYFGNLEARRVTWSYGRDLTLAPRQDGGPVNAMWRAHIEIDGQEHTSVERKFSFRSARQTRNP